MIVSPAMAPPLSFEDDELLGFETGAAVGLAVAMMRAAEVAFTKPDAPNCCAKIVSCWLKKPSLLAAASCDCRALWS